MVNSSRLPEVQMPATKSQRNGLHQTVTDHLEQHYRATVAALGSTAEQPCFPPPGMMDWCHHAASSPPAEGVQYSRQAPALEPSCSGAQSSRRNVVYAHSYTDDAPAAHHLQAVSVSKPPTLVQGLPCQMLSGLALSQPPVLPHVTVAHRVVAPSSAAIATVVRNNFTTSSESYEAAAAMGNGSLHLGDVHLSSRSPQRPQRRGFEPCPSPIMTPMIHFGNNNNGPPQYRRPLLPSSGGGIVFDDNLQYGLLRSPQAANHPTSSGRRNRRAHKRRSGMDPPPSGLALVDQYQPPPAVAITNPVHLQAHQAQAHSSLGGGGIGGATSAVGQQHAHAQSQLLASQQHGSSLINNLGSPVSSAATTAASSPSATPWRMVQSGGAVPPLIEPWERKLLPWTVQWSPPMDEMAAWQAPTLPASKVYIETMCALLEHIVASQAVPTQLTPSSPALRFDAVSVPSISVKDYLMRLYSFFSCSAECFVLAMVYIDRLLRLHPTMFCLTSLNVHRILLTAVSLAAKYFDDVYYSNSYYAKVGGLSAQELSSLESHFLSLIKYDLFVCAREYEKYRRDVTQLHAVTQASDPAEVAVDLEDAGFYCQTSEGDGGPNTTSADRASSPPKPTLLGKRTSQGSLSHHETQASNSGTRPVSISSTQCSTPSGAPSVTTTVGPTTEFYAHPMIEYCEDPAEVL